MELRKLAVFLDVVETLNFTNTAERMYTTQSNISKQIHSLEQELGEPLFSREKRIIALTEAGRLLIPYAERIVAEYQQFTKALEAQRAEQAERLRICALPSMAQYQIPKIIAQFHKQTQIQVTVEEDESYSLLPKLGDYDLVYMRYFDLPVGYETVVMEQDRFVAVLPENHPLATQSALDIRQLQAENFLQVGKHNQLYTAFLELCSEVGFKPAITYEGNRMDIILDLVANEMGVSIMMEKAVAAYQHAGVVIVPLRQAVVSELAFVRKKGGEHSTASRRFWEFLLHSKTE